LTLATPDQVSTVAGKPVARAIRNVLALWLDGKAKNGSGSQAVQWFDQPQHRMLPVSHGARPADRDAGDEAARRPDGIASGQQGQRMPHAVAQIWIVVGEHLQQRLGRGEERPRQHGELGGDQLPCGEARGE
jgi:hypothetical protein